MSCELGAVVFVALRQVSWAEWKAESFLLPGSVMAINMLVWETEKQFFFSPCYAELIRAMHAQSGKWMGSGLVCRKEFCRLLCWARQLRTDWNRKHIIHEGEKLSHKRQLRGGERERELTNTGLQEARWFNCICLFSPSLLVCHFVLV